MKLLFIDCIRGIAILMVILVHTAVQILNLDIITDVISKYCQMGVQLFFVASAYTLCLSGTNRSNESKPYIKFLIRRYFRIAPVYYLGVLMYFLISILGVFNSKFIDYDNYTFWNVLSNVFFIHGFVESANNCIVPGGWSIATEMTFYCIFPLLFFCANNFITSKMRLFSFVCLGIFLSQVLDVILVKSGFYLANNTFLYYNISNQLPCFIIGIAYFFYLKRFEYNYNKKIDYLILAILTFVALVLWSLKIGYLFSWIPIVSSLSFVFLIEIFRKNTILNFNFLINIGKVSFSMYLFHFLFTFSLPLIFENLLNYGLLSLIPMYLLVVILTYFIAKISFRFIEMPFISLGKRLILRLDKKQN